MKIKHSDLTADIDKNNPFKNCKLDREKYADILTNIVQSYSDGFVLAINNKWGTGKTTFVKMWEQSLKNKEFKTVYFNAWENDFENNPLIALIGELKLLITDGNSKSGKEKFQNVLEKGSLVTKHVGPALIKAFLDKYISTDSLKESLVGLSEGLSGVFKKEVDEYAQKKKDIESFRVSLSEFITETVRKKPLIFIVDELDRCRPDYSVSILEQIKHLFSIPNIVFVLSIDKEQLGNAVRGVYGSDNIDADEYLRRFIDLEYSLPDPPSDIYYQYLYEYFKFDDFFQSEFRYFNQNHNSDKKIFINTCSILFSNNNVNLRLQEKMFSLARTALRSYSENTYIIPQLFFFLVYIKLMDEDFYSDLKTKSLTLREIQERFHSVVKHSINYENERSLMYLEGYFVNAYDLYTRDRFGRGELFKFDKEDKKDICTISYVVNDNLNDEFHRHLEHLNSSNTHSYNLEFMLDRIDLLVNLRD